MRLLCSHCHTVFDAEPDEPHKSCPNCKAEAGLEPVKTTTPNVMRYFGLALAVLALFAVGSLLLAVVR
jgi:hypothetical protein